MSNLISEPEWAFPTEPAYPEDWKRQRKYNWRAFLTEDERKQIEEVDTAKRHWEELNAKSQLIKNKALQRAKCATLSQTGEE